MAMSTSLIISTYNWTDALTLVFESVLLQENLPDEIVIADDGSKEDTRNLIEDFTKRIKVPVKHVWHPDNGFRKTIIMNKAIHSASGNYIIQIDGDIILHPQFIKDHLQQAQAGYFIKGSRAMLDKEFTLELIASKQVNINVLSKGVGSKINATRFPILSPLFYGNTEKTSDLRGCNFAFWKKDFVEVNGYNNSLTGWGHEDIELASRLVNHGIKRKQLKMMAVCFHLYHKLNSRHLEDDNFQAYLETIRLKTKRCSNGYVESI